jgi:hypothetical protein
MQKPNGPVELPFFDFWISIVQMTRQKLKAQGSRLNVTA